MSTVYGWYMEMIGRGLRRARAIEQLASRLSVDPGTVRRILARAERDLVRNR